VRGGTILLWLLAAILLVAMALTVIFAPNRSRHGYGLLSPADTAADKTLLRAS
jgi:cytochrome c-type biogenesis protein CcmH/NrfF